MKFSINPEILEKFPGLNLGIVMARGTDNSKQTDEITKLSREIESKIPENFIPGKLAEHPKLAPWRQAYSSFGAKPKQYKCSVEALIRRVLDGEPLPRINNLVDLYNTLSLKHVLPMGGDDLDKIDGDIELKIANGSEIFREINSEETKNPKPGEVVYADEKEILCRRWNWRECDKTKLTPESKNVILYTEGLPPATKEEVQTALDDLKSSIEKFCGGEVNTYILNSTTSEIEL